MWLRKIYLIYITNDKLICQSISIGFGPNYTLTNQSIRMINSTDDFQNTTSQYKINYEQFFRGRKYSIFSSLSKYEGQTWIKFSKGSVVTKDGLPTLGVGYNGVNLYRFDIGISYNLFTKFNKFYFKPQIAIGFLKSISNGEDIYSELIEINGPDYYQLDFITAETYNIFQILPILGISTGFVLWNKLDINFNLQGAMGFRAFQKMFFKYNYKGVEQPTAIFEGRGTGIFTSICVGYRFYNKRVK